MIDLSTLPVEKWLELNAKLQQKKRALREDLGGRGVLAKDKTNNQAKYKYFSEAGYKKLFTELFSKHGLELTASASDVECFEGTQTLKFGRRASITFELHDCDTGFFESAIVTGEGVDFADKGLYKAYTGALKYYLADNFMVATGDDPEKDDDDERPQGRQNKPQTQPQPTTKQPHLEGFADEEQCALLRQYYGDRLTDMLEYHKVSRVEEMPAKAAHQYILAAIASRNKGAQNGAGN